MIKLLRKWLKRKPTTWDQAREANRLASENLGRIIKRQHERAKAK